MDDAAAHGGGVAGGGVASVGRDPFIQNRPRGMCGLWLLIRDSATAHSTWLYLNDSTGTGTGRKCVPVEIRYYQVPVLVVLDEVW